VEEIIRVEDQYYIRVTSPRVEAAKLVIKDGDTFGVFNRRGDVETVIDQREGVYHEDCRHLSRLILLIGERRPLLLSASIKEDNTLAVVDMTNPDLRIGRIQLPSGSVHITRSKFIHQGTCYEKIKIHNYAMFPVELPFSARFGADFVDTFEVRGVRRTEKGKKFDPEVTGAKVRFKYLGLDGKARETTIGFSPPPADLSATQARFKVLLRPGEERTFVISMAFSGSRPLKFEEAFHKLSSIVKGLRASFCNIHTSNEQFNDLLNRSLLDFVILLTRTPYGHYPYAGIPWFCTVFGRDGLIAGLEMLWMNPRLARDILAYLSATQARTRDPRRDAEPGKILHETRRGEMASTGKVPFGLYYGSVDSTPLFVILASEYLRWTGDLKFARTIWPNIRLAIEWMDKWGDLNGDGFLEYRRSEMGLVHQGWRDSWNAVYHDDGSPPSYPIAPCEVQGYAYAARKGAAEIAAKLGEHDLAAELTRRARDLQRKYERKFWDNGISSYVMALDGAGESCAVRCSAAGHSLFTGIASKSRARMLSKLLMSDEFFSGWGVRTISSGEKMYNPASYHNGSVWPHDNAIIGAGLSRYMFKQEALRILTSLLDASLFLENHRLPELFCGFERRAGEGPIPYPGACSPQVWASGAPFLLLQCILGLSVSGRNLMFFHPVLPPFLDEVRIKNLQVGNGSVNLTVRRRDDDVTINVDKKIGKVEVITVR